MSNPPLPTAPFKVGDKLRRSQNSYKSYLQEGHVYICRTITQNPSGSWGVELIGYRGHWWPHRFTKVGSMDLKRPTIPTVVVSDGGIYHE